MENSNIAKPRPTDVIRLDQFCGAPIRVWIDGRAVELNRVEIQFPTKLDRISAIEHLAHTSLETREDALSFLLNVLDHFSKEVPEKVVEG